MDERETMLDWCEIFDDLTHAGVHEVTARALAAKYERAIAQSAARRTTPDREAVITAAQRVVRDALDDVRVHPCDEHNDEMRANGLSELMYGLYAALQTAATTSPRDTLIEEIADMVDHMGEGRRLEEYVGAIREMKTAPTSDKGGT